MRLVVGVGLIVMGASTLSAQRQHATRDTAAPTDASRLGALEGTVRLNAGPVPAPTRVENSTDPETCGRHHTLEDLLVSAQTLGIENVILSVEGVQPRTGPRRAPDRLVIDNAQCRFSPHAAVLTVGSTIEALNSDALLHTTHLYGSVELNIALPAKGSRVARVVEKPGMIVVKCDIHSWMQAYVRVDTHPYHAVTDPEGIFHIEEIPAGSYILEVWHERLGSQELPIEVRGDETSMLEILYSLGHSHDR